MADAELNAREAERAVWDVIVVGAGITGLVAGYLLEQAGHRVTIIEANGNRVGGRIKTFRVGPERPVPPFQDPRLYAEAGAMRLPDFFPLTLALRLLASATLWPSSR